MSDFRTEHDSMGDVQVPSQAYYGAQTQRAVDNFPISGWRLPAELVHALGRVKRAAAVSNRDLGKLTKSGKNPLDNAQVDALLATEVSLGAASRYKPEGKALVAPTLWCGLAEHHMDLGGTFTLDYSTFHSLIGCLCKSIRRHSF